MIRQVYEVDPLVCPRCGGTMKIISVIERPAVIRQILDYLGLPTVTPSLRAPPDAPDAPDGLAGDHPHDWSYEPCSDLPVRPTQTGDLPVPDPMLG